MPARPVANRAIQTDKAQAALPLNEKYKTVPQKDDEWKKDTGVMSLSLAQLKEELTSQQRMLASGSLITRLPDRGEKIKVRARLLQSELDRRMVPRAKESEPNPVTIVERSVSGGGAAAVDYKPIPNENETVSTSLSRLRNAKSINETEKGTSKCFQKDTSFVHAATKGNTGSPKFAPQEKTATIRNLATTVDDDNMFDDMVAKFAGLDLSNEQGRRIWEKLVSASVPARKGGTIQISHKEAHIRRAATEAAIQQYKFENALTESGEMDADALAKKPQYSNKQLGYAYLSAYERHLDATNDDDHENEVFDDEQ